MTVALETRDAAEQLRSFLFETADWEFYEDTLRVGEGQRLRITYDGGRMEVMTSTELHEAIRTAVGRCLEHYAFATDVAILGRRNITCRREDLDKGLEPDECCYITHRPVRDPNGHLDLRNGPPPDLAIEVEITRTVLPRRPIYEALGVPELWRVDESTISVMQLVNGRYAAAERSHYFPALDIKGFNRFVRTAVTDQHAALKALDQWIRSGSSEAKK
jgi:Uma2 family endonuclease